MEKIEILKILNCTLLSEMPQYLNLAEKFDPDHSVSQRTLLRYLMNLRPPLPVKDEFLFYQDILLSKETKEKSLTDISSIPLTVHPRIKLWKGDITTLKVDAIVNAANSKMLGCFAPGHECIDNAIHSSAGVQLRLECYDIMKKQGFDEPAGSVKVTNAYNLPASYVFHSVGPRVGVSVTEDDCNLLEYCYRSCLEMANYKMLESLAFCCISTGEYRFPQERASEIAVRSVLEYIDNNEKPDIVIFNVFLDSDYQIYEKMLRSI